jgi:hypothetical protein
MARLNRGRQGVASAGERFRRTHKKISEYIRKLE